MATLTLITPTCGRTTLRNVAASVVGQLRRGDEWILVADGPQPFAQTVARKARLLTAANVVYAEVKHATSQFGNAQRDFALRIARGSHLCFLDDDDVWRTGAGEAFRTAATEQPDAVHIFKAEWGPGHHWQGILWRREAFEESNVGTPMLLIPNRPSLPLWMAWNARGTVSDFAWMQAARGARDVCWHPRLVATVRPEVRR